MNSIRAFTVYSTLREMGGTKTVPLGRRLMVRKPVPFAALFQCPFIKGYQFSCKKRSEGYTSVSRSNRLYVYSPVSKFLLRVCLVDMLRPPPPLVN